MANLTGTSAADLLEGSYGADSLLGGEGDDTLLGGAGEDTLDGGAGIDRAVVDLSDEITSLTLFLLAPAFTSQIRETRLTGVEQIWLTAGSGADGLAGGAWADLLDGGGGADVLQGGGGADTLRGGDGADSLLGGAGADVLTGGEGADLFALQGVAGVESGLGAMDRITDFSADEGDRLALRVQPAGASLLPLAGGSYGLPGGTPLPLGWGGTLAPVATIAAGLSLTDPTGGSAFLLRWLPDAASGGWLVLDVDRDGVLGGADLVVRLDLPAGTAISAADFVAGTFAVTGTTGADSLAGTAEDSRLLGFAGNDTLLGGDGNDTLLGGTGNDSLSGDAGFDSLDGGDGNDTLDGGDGPDVLAGGTGNDVLRGGAADDLLQGGAGNDNLAGGDGNDSLEGGAGADTLLGGAGADTFLVQAMGQAAWSTLGSPDLLTGFSRAEGDRLRLSDAWTGAPDGSGANAGAYTGADGIARALVWGGTARALPSLPLGTALPAAALGATGAYQVFWVPAVAGTAPAGGWLVLDLDRDAKVGAADLVVRIGSTAQPVTIGPEDFVDGTFLSVLRAGVQRAGTAGADTLLGGSLTDGFLGSAGSDRILGGAGAANTLSYAGIGGSVSVKLTAYGTGTATKSTGGTDAFFDIHGITGTAGADRLDAAAAGSGLFVTGLEGRAGNDTLVGASGTGVQANYGSSPAAIRVDLTAGTAQDGWGGTDKLAGIRRVAATSAFNDTVLGSAGDDVFLSGTGGSKTFDGRAGTDEWRYAGTGAVTVSLAAGTAAKPGGTDRLTGIEAVAGGAGNDSLLGSAGSDRLAGAAGNDTLDGGAGQDVAAYDAVAPGSDLPLRGAVVNLAAGIATDPWGGQDTLRNIESAWGSRLGDSLTGLALLGTYTFLRGLAGDDTLSAAAAGTLIVADYAGDPAAVVVDLAAGTARDGWGGTDTLVLIDHACGTGLADRLTGNLRANLLQGAAGDDTLLGGSGNDTLQPGTGSDLLDGGAGDDLFQPEADGRFTGSLTLALGDGTQRVLAFSNAATFADRLTGGTGTDRWLAPAGANLLDLRAAVVSGMERFEGGSGVDALLLPSGLASAATLLGAAGNDTLSAGAAADVLEGGDGNDLLAGQGGNDTLRGGAGTDTLLGGAGNDTLQPGAGTDRVDGGVGDDLFQPEADGRFTGSLTLALGDGTQRVLAFSNAATFADVLVGGAGTDRWLAPAGANLLDLRTPGVSGVERFEGGSGADALLLPSGLTTAATLLGAAGNDTLSAGAAADVLEGGDGNDVLAGQGGNDTLRGGAGNDLLVGGAGNDSMDGNAGSDSLLGGAGDDTLFSTDWTAVLDGGAGSDLATISRAASTRALRLDTVAGGLKLTDGVGTTLLYNLERESVTGGAGNDWLLGLGGADTLRGGAGNDTLLGGAGNDLLDGGAGRDVASFGVAYAGTRLTKQTDGSWLAVGPEGTDRLISIEVVHFIDRDVML